MISGDDFRLLTERWCKVSVMVIGDMIADAYLEGRISRISREAPVLVLEYAEEKYVPGGAANVVHNGATLGGRMLSVGIIGDDFSGRELSRVLEAKGVSTSGLIVDTERPTITKTRIMAGGQGTVRQQVVRIDRELRRPLSLAVADRELAYVKEYLPQVQAVILSDYGSGSITPAIRTHVIEWCRLRGIPCIVDSRYDIFSFRGATVVKQNEAEMAAALGRERIEPEELDENGLNLCKQLDAGVLLLTRGAQGMLLFEAKGSVTHIPVTNVSEVYDVSGAGDTVVAVMALSLAAGASITDAARLANVAAGVVIRKFGTATTSPQELQEALERYASGGTL